MSSHYGIVFPEFWSGETGREIRTHGGKDGQLVGLYLMSAPNATMIGLFSLPLRDLKHDTGIGQKGLVRAFTVLGGLGFADYDARTEHVWVREMAKFRLGLQKRSPLDPDDKRVTGIQRLYDKLAENPFLEPFFDRYAKELRLRGKRRSGRPAEHLLDVALGRGFEGPSKPVNRDQGSEIRDQVQGSGNRDQGSEDQILPPLSRRPVHNLLKTQTGKNADAPPSQNRGVATALRNHETDARAGSGERRRGVESADPRPLSQIGFHGSGSPDAGPGDVGGGTSARETARPAADAGAADVTAAEADGRTAESCRVKGAPGAAGSAGASHSAADDGRPERTEPDGGAARGVAGQRGTESASGEPGEPLDQNGEGVETPGQAKLRLAIAELKRKFAR